MRPDDHDLDDEIRSNLAINVKERVDRGEDPEAARVAALRDLGYVPAVRDSMRRVWRRQWLDDGGALVRDIRFAFRSLLRAKGLTITVVITLALGIGANAAIFSVVRSVLLRPLVNRDADRLIYIRQAAHGLGIQNLTFSVPEINDFRSRARTVTAFGEFSTVEFTLIGFGREPRLVRAGVVNGAFFEVMGLRPLLGRLLTPADDGPAAPGAAVLTHRFWKDVLNSDPTVVGQTIRLGSTTAATVVGVLEPSVPYPTETQIIANMVTSPHHLGATMNTDRKHRMTDLFARLTPDTTMDAARAELTGVHSAILGEFPEAYSPQARLQLEVRTLQEQIASPARTILLVLMAAAAIVFIIACSNVANLILARSVRREGELAVRAALGAGRGALRRTLLAESLVLCAAGAALGLLLAQPLVTVAGTYAARFSVRALESTVDAGVLWLGAGLALAAAVLLAYIPRLPSADRSGGLLAGGSVRITTGTNRRLRIFATTQIACTFVLLAGAGMLVATLTALQTANTGYELRKVLAIDLPGTTGPGVPEPGRGKFLQEAVRRVGELPGVEGVAMGGSVPFRDRSTSRLQFVAEGYQPANGEEAPTGRVRDVSTQYFAVLGVPLLAGRYFTDDDPTSKENVVIVNQSVAQRLFPNGDALNRRLTPSNLGTNLGSRPIARIVGIVADVDEDNVVQEPSMIVYYPLRGGSRLFVRAAGDPRALIPSVTRTIRALSADQAVERPATLEDIRAEVLAPERLNAFVFSTLSGIALLIAVVGIGGVLAFSVSARTREFGVRLAIGSTPRNLLAGVLWDGVRIASIGVAAGAVGGFALARAAGGLFSNVQLPGALPLVAAGALLIGAVIVASLMPAARASRVDVLQAVRSE